MASTVFRANGQARELNQGGTSTSETVFTTDGTVPVVLPLPTAGQLADASGTTTALFRVHAWGRVTGGTTTNFTAQLLAGTSATAGSNTDVETTGAIACNSESENWYVGGLFTLDTTSNKLNGQGTGWVGSTDVAIDSTGQATSIDPDANGTLGFVVSGTFSSGNASNVATLDGFVLEQIL